MTSFFTRRIKVPKEGRSDVFAGRIVNMITLIQKSWAGWMSKKINRLSDWAKWALLVSFCITSVAVSVWIAFIGFSENKQSAIKINRIKTPATIYPDEVSESKINQKVQDNIKRFRFFMDSLAHSPSGKKQYDSILRYRPGLLDSVTQLEKIFQ